MRCSGVSYAADPDALRRILLAVAATHPDVARTPEPEVFFLGFGDSSLDFELRVWINPKTHSENRTKRDLYFAIHPALAGAGIEIPYPQRDLHLRSVAAGVLPGAGGARGD